MNQTTSIDQIDENTPPEVLQELLENNPELQEAILAEEERLKQQQKILFYQHNGEKYLEYHNSHKKIRAFLGGNRSGKTYTVCAEDATHLTGRYPDWWEGRRYSGPIEFWAASDTAETTRDILQKELLGTDDIDEDDSIGTGLIPKEDIISWNKRRNTPGAVDKVYIKHYNEHGEVDGKSEIQFKSYDQGRKKFQGTTKDRIHLDEEPPQDVFDECYMRTVSSGGEIALSMTPLQGETDLYTTITEATEDDPIYFHKHISLLDNPHIPDEEKATLQHKFSGIDYLSRIEGIAVNREGKIYPQFNYRVHVRKMPIEGAIFTARVMDPGLRITAVIWAHVYFNQAGQHCVHVFRELYKKEWSIGKIAERINLQELQDEINLELIDPAADKRDAQSKGENTFKRLNRSKELGGFGFRFLKANNDVEGGIQAVREFLRYSVDDGQKVITHPRLTFDPSCVNTIREHNGYRYKSDKSGQPVKRDDHTCDDVRYLINHLTIGIRKKKKRKKFSRKLNSNRYG